MSDESRVIIGLEPSFLKVLEDAERWRKLHREDPDATIDIYEEFDAAIEELNFLRDKLETVKKLVETGPNLVVLTSIDVRQAIDDWLGKMMNARG